eukprot:symbB.v1.2.006938.t1/scaffold421.1/size207896/1
MFLLLAASLHLGHAWTRLTVVESGSCERAGCEVEATCPESTWPVACESAPRNGYAWLKDGKCVASSLLDEEIRVKLACTSMFESFIVRGDAGDVRGSRCPFGSMLQRCFCESCYGRPALESNGSCLAEVGSQSQSLCLRGDTQFLLQNAGDISFVEYCGWVPYQRPQNLPATSYRNDTDCQHVMLSTLEFVEHLMQNGCGANTPKAVLLALDYYGKAFGFESQKGHFGRAKRLSMKCAENPIQGRVGAPLFGNEFINALECIVMDPFLHSPQRVAAGKLRLCIQSSTRYDDILNTPLGQCEWVRKKGELSIIGLRSKALRGKNKARAWIASTLGITPGGDKWLPTLMDLLLKSHKEGWKTDDHLGKLASRDGKFFHDSPAIMDADVNVLKNVLLENRSQPGYSEVLEDEVVKMRWHGAKATLTTVMQHINLPPRVVRFAGDWSASGESMANLYLREAQLLTLDAQQKAIHFLRMGDDELRLCLYT